MLRLEDVLPHVGALSSLCSLTLGLPLQDAHILLHLSALQHLPSLSSLSLAFPNDHPLSGADLCALATMTHLPSLSLPGGRLDTSAIELLASLPKLTTLSAASLHPDRDLSRLPCAWQHLSLTSCTSVRQISLLPLAAVTSLQSETFDDDWVDCPLSATDNGLLATSVAILRSVAETLARATPSDIGLQLAWDGKPSTSQLLPALSALAPLRHHRSLSLHLGEHWDLSDGEVLRQLAEHVPNLAGLHTGALGGRWGSFAGFVAAVGSALTRLSTLVPDGCSSELLRLPESGADREALVKMASGRGRLAGPRLVVSLSFVDASDVWLAAEYNQLVAGSSRGRLGFKLYERDSHRCFE